MRKFILILAALTCLPSFAEGKSSGSDAPAPIALNLLPEKGQVPPPDWGILGARISILWGRNKNMVGLDIGGVGNVTDNVFAGSAIAGGFNHTSKQAFVLGFQAAGIANVNKGEAIIIGLQLAGLVNANQGKASIIGLQLAAMNIGKETDVYGVQVGLYNKANRVVGLQVGAFNEAQSLKGIQIGLININYDAHPFRMFPIVNVGF